MSVSFSPGLPAVGVRLGLESQTAVAKVQKIDFAFLLGRHSLHNDFVKEGREGVKGDGW
jgi:hypothetical protein